MPFFFSFFWVKDRPQSVSRAISPSRHVAMCAISPRPQALRHSGTHASLVPASISDLQQAVMGSHCNSLMAIAFGGTLAFIYLSYRQHRKSRSRQYCDSGDEDEQDASGRSTTSRTSRSAALMKTTPNADGSSPPIMSATISTEAESLLPGHVKREILKEKRRRKKMEEFSCKKPVYDNMRMYDPRDRLLCTISKKKAHWYIKKDLAMWLNDDQTAIRLNFEPKNAVNTVDDAVNNTEGTTPPSFDGESADDVVYLKSNKMNRCCCCGVDKHIRRHYVVPHAFRKHFPPQFKSHLSSDIVILCGSCHVVCDQQYQERVKEMEEECSVDEKTGLPIPHEPPYLVDTRQYHVRSCALALLRWRESLPNDKIEAYERVVCEYLGIALTENFDANVELIPERLQQAIDVDYRKSNPSYVPGPERIVSSLKGDDEQIKHFVVEWRKYFIDIMAPRYLPAGWGIDLAVKSN